MDSPRPDPMTPSDADQTPATPPVSDPPHPLSHVQELTPEYETVLTVRHWTDAYFSFTTTRDAGLRFENGQFVMIGLNLGGKLVKRAYSIASPNWDEHLEFFSIKVQNGLLTSQLQHIQPGDQVYVSHKPTGTLLISDLRPGRNLFLMATGTGLAPFLAVVRDPETYERFERVIVAHGVRHVEDLAYRDYLTQELPRHEYLGDLVSKQLLYYPVVSREPFPYEGRVTTRLDSGEMAGDLGLDPLDPAHDRVMICGSTQMLADLRRILDARGFAVSPRIGTAGDYVFERAFVDK